jgi:A nuclease family of the HNH/ENDO VII superfamily with conserved AHH
VDVRITGIGRKEITRARQSANGDLDYYTEDWYDTRLYYSVSDPEGEPVAKPVASLSDDDLQEYVLQAALFKRAEIQAELEENAEDYEHARGTLLIGIASLAPGVDEGLDVTTLQSPEASTTDKALASISLTMGVLTVGLLPNISTLKLLKRITLGEWRRVLREAGKVGIKVTEEIAKSVKLSDQLDLPVFVQRTMLRENLKLAKGSRKIAHHLIPLEAIGRFKNLLRKGAEGGFDLNAAYNGVRLKPGAAHFGGHPKYNEAVLMALQKIDATLSPAETAKALRDVANTLRAALRKGEFGPWQ